MGVGKDLNLDMTAVINQPLEHQGAVAKRALRLAPRTQERLRDLVGRAHQAHAAPAATGHSLYQQRKAELQSFLCQACIVLLLTQIARCTRHAGRQHAALGQSLVAHCQHGRRRRADEDQPCIQTGLGKAGVFAQKTIAWVHGVSAGLARCLQQTLDAQIRIRRRRSADVHCLVGQPHMRRRLIGVAVNGNSLVTELARRANHPAGDLAPVGNQDLGKTHGMAQFGLRF